MDNEQMLLKVVEGGSSTNVALEPEFDLVKIGQTVCGFLNGEGGEMLIGISSGGTVKGLANAKSLVKKTEQYLIKNIIPEAAITVSSETVSNRDILAVKVWGGAKKPYIFNGSIYFRKKSKTEAATSSELSQLVHERKVSQIHWERQPVLGFYENDLDAHTLNEIIEKARELQRTKELPRDPLEFLNYYGLYTNGNFTNACVLLFSNKPVKFIPQCRVRAAVLESGKTGDTFRQDFTFEDNLFRTIEKVETFLKANVPLISKFEEQNWKREDKFIYPMTALREGVLNSLVHRDYSNVSGTTSILIYKESLEITNYGKLPSELTISDLKKSHVSLPINPDIAQMCFISGYIEKIGRGTLKILESCKTSKLKEPKWSQQSSTVKLTFFSNISKLQSEGVNEGVNEGVIFSRRLSSKEEKKIDEIIEGVSEGVSEGVKNRWKNIISVLYIDGSKNSNEIAKAMTTPVKTIERYLKQLREAELLEFVGAPKTGGYKLVSKVNSKISAK